MQLLKTSPFAVGILTNSVSGLHDSSCHTVNRIPASDTAAFPGTLCPWEHLPSLRWQVVRRLPHPFRLLLQSNSRHVKLQSRLSPFIALAPAHYHGVGIDHHRSRLSPSKRFPVYFLSRPLLPPRPKAVVRVNPIIYPCFPRRALLIRPSTVEGVSHL